MSEPTLIIAPYEGPGDYQNWPAYTLGTVQIPRGVVDILTDEKILSTAHAVDSHPSARGLPNLYWAIAAERLTNEIRTHLEESRED